jgi:hypothetical protein
MSNKFALSSPLLKFLSAWGIMKNPCYSLMLVLAIAVPPSSPIAAQQAQNAQKLKVSLAKPVTYETGGQGPGTIAAVDLLGNGVLDLVVSNTCVNTDCQNGTVGVLLGNGDGTFQPATSYSTGAPTLLQKTRLHPISATEISASMHALST